MERGRALAATVSAAAMLLLMVADCRVDARLGQYQEHEVEVVHVDGQVLCQDCTERWTEWIHGKPIKGAKVAVTCLDGSGRGAAFHGSGTTDDKGEFDLPVSRHYAYGRVITPEVDCTVKLVSSPDAACDIVTDFGGGMSGVKPGKAWAVRPAGRARYSVGPFFFTSPACGGPDETTSL